MIKREKLFCVDCQKYTWQKFIKEMRDKTLLYVCEVCNCENSEKKQLEEVDYV